MQKKVDKIQSMLVSARDEEAKFIIRYIHSHTYQSISSLEGNLRIGLAEKTVLSALAQAVLITSCKSTNPNFTLNI